MLIETSSLKKKSEMFFTRSFNEIRSARGRRPAASWSQSALQPQGSRSAARTTRERWEVCLPLLFCFLAMDNVKETARKAQQERACKHFCLALQVMEFYCESCETAMCLDCTEGEHREHVTVPLRDVVEQHKAVLKTQLDAIRSRWGHFDEALRIFASHQVV